MKNPSPSNWSKLVNLPARVPFFYGWLILPVAALSLFISGPGQTYGVSIFVDPMIKDFLDTGVDDAIAQERQRILREEGWAAFLRTRDVGYDRG